VSFLLYAGGLAILLSLYALLASLSGDYGAAAFVGWTLLVYAVLAVCAFGARRAGHPVTAGLLALSAVVALITFVGALEDWFGWLPHAKDPFAGFHIGAFLLELVAIVVSFAALRIFRFPLFVLFTTALTWFFVTDLLSGGGNWTAVVTLVFGLLLVPIGSAANPVNGFWVHVVAGVTIGGALLYFWHAGDVRWILAAIVGLVFILVGNGLGRSSYAVLGVFGLLLSWTHFVSGWFGLGVPALFGFYGGGGGTRWWAVALCYAGYGLALMVIALALEHRRGAVAPPA
jgi:hypothetical protein